MAESGPTRAHDAEAAEARNRAAEADALKQVGARHVLVMHAESVRKPPGVTRSRLEAQARAQEALAKVRSGVPFESLVKEYSDEPGAADRGGDLGVFERKRMVKPFADAAFALKVGEVSEVVETPFGFHIIKRTE